MAPVYTIEIYRLNVVAGTFTRLDTIETFRSLSYFERLNGIGGAMFELSLFDSKATANNLQRFRNQVVIKRNGVVVWFGPITKTRGRVRGVEGYIRVECSSYLYHLKARNTDKNVIYTNTDASTIAWNLISTTEGYTNGNLNITQGTLTTSVVRDRQYALFSIASALINLTNVINGFDMRLLPVVNSNGLLTSVTFNTYYPRLGTKRSDLPKIEYGENLMSFDFMTDGEITNYVYAEGSGTGDSVIVSVSELTASEQAYTRREEILSAKDISIQSTLDNLATSYTTKMSVENFTFEFDLNPAKSPLYGEYSLGDSLVINFEIPNSGGYATFNNREARVVELAVDIDPEGVEMVTPKLSLSN